MTRKIRELLSLGLVASSAAVLLSAAAVLLPGCPFPRARAAQIDSCRQKGLAIIHDASTCHDAVTALEWLALTDPDCRAAELEGGVIGPGDCPDEGREGGSDGRGVNDSGDR